jgi:alpha-amylase
MKVWLDVVNHQRMGGDRGTYHYRSATGRANGRFPKMPSYFRGASPRVPEDPVPVPVDDFSFGDELCPVNARPKGAVWDGLIAAGDWLFGTTGAQGARLDDMKGMNVGFMRAWMDAGTMASREFFGEYDDGNPANIEWWIGQVDQRASALDFAFQENMVYPMCMRAGGGGGWQMSWMGTDALLFRNPMKAVTFVSSPDSETDGWATIINNKTLGLALMFGMMGLPMVYIKDWLPRSLNGYALNGAIDNLVWCSRCLASGGMAVVYCDAKTYVFERTGPPGVLVALNNDIWNPNWTTVTCRSQHPPGTVLHDYTGKNRQNCTVDASGNIAFGIPPAENGQGYGFWAPAGVDGEITFPALRCTQIFFGAEDLDTGPAVNGKLAAGRLWIRAGSSIDVELNLAKSGGIANSMKVECLVSDPAGITLGKASSTTPGEPSRRQLSTSRTGWHGFSLKSTGLPAAGSPFALTVDYAAPQTISPGEF